MRNGLGNGLGPGSRRVCVATPESPVALAATGVLDTSFVANWGAVTGATSYELDVSTSSTFATFVSGYESKAVSGTSQAVTGLTQNTTYYYRLRAVKSGKKSDNSNSITRLTYLTETGNYIRAALALTPTPGDIRYHDHLNTFIGTLKTQSIWDKFDCLYLANFEDLGSQLNLVNPAVTASKINTVAYADKYGWSVEDISCGLDLGVSLNSAKANKTTKYVNGSGSMLIYLWDNYDVAGSGATPSGFFGSRTDASNNSNDLYKSGTAPYQKRFIFTSYQDSPPIAMRSQTGDIDNAIGLIAMSRNTNSDYFLRINKNTVAGNSTNYGVDNVLALAAKKNDNVFSLSYNNNGTIFSASLLNIRCPFHAVAGYLTNTELGTIETAIETYLSAIGAAR